MSCSCSAAELVVRATLLSAPRHPLPAAASEHRRRPHRHRRRHCRRRHRTPPRRPPAAHLYPYLLSYLLTLSLQKEFFLSLQWSVVYILVRGRDLSNFFSQLRCSFASDTFLPAGCGPDDAGIAASRTPESSSTPPSVPLLRAAALSEHAVEHGQARRAQRRPAGRGRPLFRQEGARPRTPRPRCHWPVALTADPHCAGSTRSTPSWVTG